MKSKGADQSMREQRVKEEQEEEGENNDDDH